MADSKTPPAIKAHTTSEIQLAVTYLGLYKGLYNTPDYSDGGLCRLLIGFKNYLDTLPTGSLNFGASLSNLTTGGFI